MPGCGKYQLVEFTRYGVQWACPQCISRNWPCFCLHLVTSAWRLTRIRFFRKSEKIRTASSCGLSLRPSRNITRFGNNCSWVIWKHYLMGATVFSRFASYKRARLGIDLTELPHWWELLRATRPEILKWITDFSILVICHRKCDERCPYLVPVLY